MLSNNVSLPQKKLNFTLTEMLKWGFKDEMLIGCEVIDFPFLNHFSRLRVAHFCLQSPNPF